LTRPSASPAGPLGREEAAAPGCPAAYPMWRRDPLVPPPAYGELRRLLTPQRVQLADGRQAWLLTGYDQIRAAMRNPRIRSDGANANLPTLVPETRALSFFHLDGPEHLRLRHMAIPALSGSAVRRMTPLLRQTTAELLDAMSAGPRPADLVADLADPLATRMIAGLLGVPRADHAYFRRRAQIVTSAASSPQDFALAMEELRMFLEHLITTRLRDGGPDLVSRLCTRYLRTGEVSRDDVVAMTTLLLLAGHAVAHQIALSTLLLLRAPEQWDLLRQVPALIPLAVDELLRRASIVQHDLVRTAATDIHINATPIAAGDGIILALPSANHDETVFPDPARLDVCRSNAPLHLAFGQGAHKCPGAALATAETRIALHGLLTRFPQLRLAGDFDDIPFRHHTPVYGVTMLAVTW
jgi:cytochrome P450